MWGTQRAPTTPQWVTNPTPGPPKRPCVPLLCVPTSVPPLCPSPCARILGPLHLSPYPPYWCPPHPRPFAAVPTSPSPHIPHIGAIPIPVPTSPTPPGWCSPPPCPHIPHIGALPIPVPLSLCAHNPTPTILHPPPTPDPPPPLPPPHPHPTPPLTLAKSRSPSLSRMMTAFTVYRDGSYGGTATVTSVPPPTRHAEGSPPHLSPPQRGR